MGIGEEPGPSHVGGDDEHKQTASSSKGKVHVNDVAVHAIAATLLPKDLGTTGGASEHQVRTTSTDPIPVADVAETVSSLEPTQESMPGAPASATTTRAYDVRFAYPAVCVCAEHSTVQDAIQRLVGAVRETATMLTRLHSEESLQQQCALLGRMFEFDCFLW